MAVERRRRGQPQAGQGGSFEAGKALPVIWIFTCNPIERFEKRFLTRSMVLDFSMYGESKEIADYLSAIWERETSVPTPNFARIVKDSASNVRGCLIQLDRLLLEG